MDTLYFIGKSIAITAIIYFSLFEPFIISEKPYRIEFCFVKCFSQGHHNLIKVNVKRTSLKQTSEQSFQVES